MNFQTRLLRPWLAGMMFLGLCLLAGSCGAEGPRKPSILFSCPNENRYYFVGYDYMQALVKAGFEVDFIEGAKELAWDRVKNFNVLVVLDFPAPGPGADEMSTEFSSHVPPWLDEYFGVVDRFLKAGGSVFLHYDPMRGGQAPNHLLKPWGIQFPLIYLKDSSTQRLTNLSNGNTCAFTDQVLPSPVSEGVRGIWYPIDRFYCGAFTMPILVDDKWQVVVRASKMASTVVATFSTGEPMHPPKDALVPITPIKDPVLFAIRDCEGGAGRIAAVQQQHQFSIGSGMKFLYNHEILSKGLSGVPSDYGRLLLNTFKWLAEPSLKNGAVGGHVTDLTRLNPIQLRPGAQEAFAEWIYREEKVEKLRSPSGSIYRGLIGAQSVLSGGKGTVADYAKAAVELGLDFLVFLEDFDQLTPSKLEELKNEVKKNTTDKLQLFAGYKMRTNIGNFFFTFGKNPIWPHDRMLVGADKKVLNLQFQDAAGKWALGNPSLQWTIYDLNNQGNNVGYFKFSQSPKGMQVYDLHGCSAAGIRTYENGKRVEDQTADYLTAVQCMAVPSPLGLNITRSTEEMREAVKNNQALTYAQAPNLAAVYDHALRWNNSYDGINVFASDGPIIRVWPNCKRGITFGAEPFVTGRSLAVCPINVTSAVGLKNVQIYDGQNLFRRFICSGAKEFQTVLLISGMVQRNLVLMAEDVKGGTATSFPYRTYPEGNISTVWFCSDHVNDLKLMHGPSWVESPWFAPILNVDVAGYTWDGGPRGEKRFITIKTDPGIFTSAGNFNERMDECPYQIPLIEFTDEGAGRGRCIGNRVLAEGVVPRVSPWHGFGPIEPNPLVNLWGSYTLYNQYVTGVSPNEYGAPGVMEGPVGWLFTEQVAFKEPMTVNRLRLLQGLHTYPENGLLIIGHDDQIQNVVEISEKRRLSNPDGFGFRTRLETGAWFAFYSAMAGNTQVFINRGPTVILEGKPQANPWLFVWADLTDKAVKTGETYDAEFFSMTWPINQMFRDVGSLAKVVPYLANPTGLKLLRGRREESKGGLLELVPDNHAVELTIPKPETFSPVSITVPLRLSGLNKRWSAGLYQVDGYRTHYYSQENSGWRAVGLDFDGRAYVPLYVSQAPQTHVVIGHPVVADQAGKDLFIQVTRLSDSEWHVSVNNPLDVAVTTTLKKTMDLPNLTFNQEKITLQPGEYRVLEGADFPQALVDQSTQYVEAETPGGNHHE